MRLRSLKSRVAWTYAGLTVLTVLILGGIMLGMLATYYQRAEANYLRAAQARVMQTPPRSEGRAGYENWARIAALGAQTRVRLVTRDGAVLADSGAPDLINPRNLMGAPPAAGGAGPRGRLPGPLGGGILGGQPGSPRSDAELRTPVQGYGLPAGTVLVLSEGPASGGNVLTGITEAWLIAAVLATAISVLVGWFVASRIAQPIDELTEASDRMAGGDLAARANVARDDEVGRLAESFNKMASRTEVTVTTLRRFVGDAAHEIGTPLTALQADLELVERRAVEPEERRLIRRALTQVDRLGALSANLLRLSRLEAGALASKEEEFDLNSVAREAADATASLIEQAGLGFVLEIAPAPLRVRASSDALQFAVKNLLDNAVKFTPEGGTITLATSAEDRFALLTVADTGIGIPVDEQERVFERFHRARNASEVAGSGLGLAIVKATAEQSGGSVALSSSSAGTTFRLRLPLV